MVQYNGELVIWVCGVGDKLFVVVDQIVVFVSGKGGGDVGGVGGCYIWFVYGEVGVDFVFQQWCQLLMMLGVVGEVLQQFYIVVVWCVVVEYFCCLWQVFYDFCQWCVVQGVYGGVGLVCVQIWQEQVLQVVFMGLVF